jgi:hypothetical protein
LVAVARKSSHFELDRRVRECLSVWPQRPPGIEPSVKQPGTWLKARPHPGPVVQPYLKVPGSQRLRTLPDGLYLHFSDRPDDLYVDLLCIEACSTYQNLLDKRSRFAPSTGSLLAVCPLEWLQQPAQEGSRIPRWRLLRCLTSEPRHELVLPVRDARVLFALREAHYETFASTQTPQAHEFFVPMEVITGGAAEQDPALRAMLGRATAAAHFLRLPEPPLV